MDLFCGTTNHLHTTPPSAPGERFEVLAPRLLLDPPIDPIDWNVSFVIRLGKSARERSATSRDCSSTLSATGSLLTGPLSDRPRVPAANVISEVSEFRLVGTLSSSSCVTWVPPDVVLTSTTGETPDRRPAAGKEEQDHECERDHRE